MGARGRGAAAREWRAREQRVSRGFQSAALTTAAGANLHVLAWIEATQPLTRPRAAAVLRLRGPASARRLPRDASHPLLSCARAPRTPTRASRPTIVLAQRDYALEILSVGNEPNERQRASTRRRARRTSRRRHARLARRTAPEGGPAEDCRHRTHSPQIRSHADAHRRRSCPWAVHWAACP